MLSAEYVVDGVYHALLIHLPILLKIHLFRTQIEAVFLGNYYHGSEFIYVGIQEVW